MASQIQDISILQWYEKSLSDGELNPDDFQAAAVEQLEKIVRYIQAAIHQQQNKGKTGRFLQGLTGRPPAPRGAYLWGGVGRGKTMLMDTFAELLGPSHVLRIHFHAFMADIHHLIRRDHACSATMNRVIQSMMGDRQLICLDEFIVTEIGDAMLLKAILEAFSSERIVLVTTSNVEPQKLYEDGLNRQSFLPAIDLLESLCETIHLRGDYDYRVTPHAIDERIYRVLPAQEHASAMAELFREITGEHELMTGETIANHHVIQMQAVNSGHAWFTFDELCQETRSTYDYMALSNRFHTILISAVPQLDDPRLDACYRFINLVDDLYEKRVKLMVSADVPLQSIYTGHQLQFEFKRLISRLTEMQSLRYQTLAHRPD